MSRCGQPRRELVSTPSMGHAKNATDSQTGQADSMPGCYKSDLNQPTARSVRR